MTKFFVGQRVRLVRPVLPKNQGREDTICNLFEEKMIGGLPANCKLSNSPPLFYTHTSRLEPILPEGAQPSKFSFQELLEDLNERSYERSYEK